MPISLSGIRESRTSSIEPNILRTMGNEKSWRNQREKTQRPVRICVCVCVSYVQNAFRNRRKATMSNNIWAAKTGGLKLNSFTERTVCQSVLCELPANFRPFSTVPLCQRLSLCPASRCVRILWCGHRIRFLRSKALCTRNRSSGTHTYVCFNFFYRYWNVCAETIVVCPLMSLVLLLLKHDFCNRRN